MNVTLWYVCEYSLCDVMAGLRVCRMIRMLIASCGLSNDVRSRLVFKLAVLSSQPLCLRGQTDISSYLL